MKIVRRNVVEHSSYPPYNCPDNWREVKLECGHRTTVACPNLSSKNNFTAIIPKKVKCHACTAEANKIN